VIGGKGAMPPMAGSLTDAEIRAADDNRVAWAT